MHMQEDAASKPFPREKYAARASTPFLPNGVPLAPSEHTHCAARDRVNRCQGKVVLGTDLAGGSGS